jgi:hypothetical protein
VLSSRLKKLEACGVLKRRPRDGGIQYGLTRAGEELGPVVTQLGTWAQRWFRSTFAAGELDVGVLMWDIRCTVDASALPSIRAVLGPRELQRCLDSWLGLSPYAPIADARRAPLRMQVDQGELPAKRIWSNA